MSEVVYILKGVSVRAKRVGYTGSPLRSLQANFFRFDRA